MKSKTILPRTSYSLFILDLPGFRGNTLKNAIHNYLIGLFPDNLADRPIVIKRNSRKKGSHLVFVLEPGQPRKPLPVLTLFIMRYFKRKNARVLLIDAAYAELILIENGALIKSEVKMKAALDLSNDIFRFFGDKTEKLDIFCNQIDLPLINSAEHKYNITIHELDKEFSSLPRHSYSLYEQLSAAKRLQKCFLGLAVLLILTGTGGGIYRYREINREETSRVRILEEKQKQRDAAERQDRERLFELQERYRLLVENKAAGPYETIDVISRCMDTRTRITHISVKDGFFQMEVLAPDSLEILKAFENSGKIGNPLLQQIHPEGNRERFTISGTVLPEKEKINSFLAVKEQIKLMEALIKKEELSAARQENFFPSAFGVNIRGLLTKWNCSINSYQYMTAGNSREIEFSAKAASANFLGFLREASANNKGWIFTLVQIHNLAPQNAVNAVIRVKAETIIENGELAVEPYTEFPVSGMSRHFYVAPPPPPPVIIAEVIEEIPPPPLVELPPEKPEHVSWLEYIGAAGDDTGRQFIYVKNNRNGAIIRLDDTVESENRYSITAIDAIAAQIGGKLYEIKKK